MKNKRDCQRQKKRKAPPDQSSMQITTPIFEFCDFDDGKYLILFKILGIKYYLNHQYMLPIIKLILEYPIRPEQIQQQSNQPKKSARKMVIWLPLEVEFKIPPLEKF